VITNANFVGLVARLSPGPGTTLEVGSTVTLHLGVLDSGDE
jgi:hypothetical protein